MIQKAVHGTQQKADEALRQLRHHSLASIETASNSKASESHQYCELFDDQVQGGVTSLTGLALRPLQQADIYVEFSATTGYSNLTNMGDDFRK